MENSGPGTKRRKTFLDLPAEIRNYIYELALVHSTPIYFGSIFGSRVVQAAASTTLRTSPCEHFHSKNAAIGLLLVNRQMHTESAPILYGSNQFEFANLPAAALWTAKIGESADHLRKLCLWSLRCPSRSSDTTHYRLRQRNLLRDWLSCLRHALGMQKLSISWGLKGDAKWHCKLLEPLMRNIRDHRRQLSVAFRLADIMGISGSAADAPFVREYARLMGRTLRSLLLEPEEKAAIETRILTAVRRMFGPN